MGEWWPAYYKTVIFLAVLMNVPEKVSNQYKSLSGLLHLILWHNIYTRMIH